MKNLFQVFAVGVALFSVPAYAEINGPVAVCKEGQVLNADGKCVAKVVLKNGPFAEGEATNLVFVPVAAGFLAAALGGNNATGSTTSTVSTISSGN